MTSAVDRMPTNRRRFIRRSHPSLETRLGREVYPATDWSLGGIAVRGLADCLDRDSGGIEITGYFGLTGEDIAFKFSAAIARIDIDRDVVGLDFTRLWPESAEILDDLFRRPPTPRLPRPAAGPRDTVLRALDATTARLTRRWPVPPRRD